MNSKKRVKYDISKNVECEENDVKILYIVSNKDGVDYMNPIYNGIYSDYIYNINELDKILRNYE